MVLWDSYSNESAGLGVVEDCYYDNSQAVAVIQWAMLVAFLWNRRRGQLQQYLVYTQCEAKGVPYTYGRSSYSSSHLV